MKTIPVTKTFENSRVLDVPALELERGKIYALIGANGSGKSTFARILAGVLPADRSGRPLEESVRVGYMPQKSFAFRMSVVKNVCLTGGSRERAMELLHALGIGHLAERKAGRLSGGETARMALARIAMMPYDLVILDEPTASMDVESTLLAEDMMRRIVSESGCALLLVTHSLQQARRVADEALYLQKGRLLESGPAAQLLYAPAKEDTQRFLQFYGI